MRLAKTFVINIFSFTEKMSIKVLAEVELRTQELRESVEQSTLAFPVTLFCQHYERKLIRQATSLKALDTKLLLLVGKFRPTMDYTSSKSCER